MNDLLNAARLQAIQAMGERASTRLGTVQSYDQSNYTVRVAIEPEGNLSGWIPVLSPWIGNGWGMFCPPSIGDLVEVQFQEADHGAPMCCLRLFNDQERPLAVPSGEFWLVHKSGAFIKLTNDGKLLVNSAVEIDATAPKVNITTTSDVTVSAGGNVNVSAVQANVTASASASVTAPAITLGAAAQTLKSFITDAFIAFFNGHTHTSNASGSPTSIPNQAMSSAAHATTTVKGG